MTNKSACIVHEVKKSRTLLGSLEGLSVARIVADAEFTPVIIRGQVSPDQIERIKKKVTDDFAGSPPSPDQRYYVGCPNVFKILQRDYLYYRPEYRSLWNYFIWNQESGNELYELGLQFVEVVNKLAGLPENYGHDPKCGHFYTISTMCYPRGGGFLAPHVDSYAQKYQALLMMSEWGKDFEEGGLYFFDRDQNNRYLEPELKLGDILLLPSTVVHGVYPIDPRYQGEISPFRGRWALFTPMPSASLLVDGPGISKPVTIQQHIPKNM